MGFQSVKSSSSLHTYTFPSFHGLAQRTISGGSRIRRVTEINRKRQDVNSIPWVYGVASQDRTREAVISSPSPAVIDKK